MVLVWLLPPAAPALSIELVAAEDVCAAAMDRFGWDVDVPVVEEDVEEREVEEAEVEVEVKLGFTFVTCPLTIQLPTP